VCDDKATMEMNRAEAFSRLSNTNQLAADFNELTAIGGRLFGSRSEAAAREWLDGRLRKLDKNCVTGHEFPSAIWASNGASLELAGPGGTEKLACHPLYWSAETPANGLEAELIDVGRGTDADFDAVQDKIRGKAVIVRHEFPFSPRSIHRRVKYRRSCELGAAAFVIVNDNPGNLLVTGSCGQDSPQNIPAVGVSLETGAKLAAARGRRARLRIATTRRQSTGVNLIAETPGNTSEWVVVCAHYDGHDLAQSALDNATGVAAAIAIFESFQPFVAALRRGLRLILFSAEETGLLGSRLYLQGLCEADRRNIALAVNLDTLAGSSRLTCLTSGFDELPGFVQKTCAATGMNLACYQPLVRNSDHFNFAELGIPAMRVIAGFDEPESGSRLLLTEADTADRVSSDELRRATVQAGALVWSALDWPGSIAQHKPPPIPG
jgi:aminopeptidase YwaD